MRRHPIPSSTVALRAVSGFVCFAALLWLAGCAPRPQLPEGVNRPLDPFRRLPYLQAVHGDSAVIRWRVEPGSPGGLQFRRGSDPGWRSADVVELERGDRRVAFSDLAPRERITYRVRAGGVTAGPYSFRAAPPDTSSSPVRVLAFGDSGWGSPQQVDLARRMAERSWDLSVHVGDVAYPDGTEFDLTRRHFDVYDRIFPTVPFFPVPGNHDLKTRRGAPYDRAFEWPGGTGGRWYGFRWGHVQFLGLDTSVKARTKRLAREEGPQYRWFAAKLDSVARDTTVRWTVVYTHEPMYSHRKGFLGHGPSEEVREALEPLLLEHGVDLVLAGHDHHYERTKPLRRGIPVAPGCGTVHMVIGGGGAERLYRSVGPDEQTARVDRSYHFLGLRFGRNEITGRAVDPAGEVFDLFRLSPYDASDGEDECD